VAQHRALGEPGRAARVLDLRRVVRADRRQPDVASVGADDLVELIEAQHVAQPGQVGTDRLGVRRQPVAPDLGHEEQPGRPRLPEHVGGLGRPQARVNRYEGQPGERRAVLEQHPLGQVVRPHGDALARLEVLQKVSGAALGVDEQLSIGPAPSLRRRQPLHDGDAIRHLGGDLTQPAADRGAGQQRRPAAVGDPVRGGQGVHATTAPAQCRN
jgi:hypothetical protein